MKKQTFIPIPCQGRVSVFDSLKSLMIFLVIVLHVSMTFMICPPSWWSVISDERSYLLTAIVLIVDLFIIPVLFFVAGYFTPSSFLKKGISGFLKDKSKHIAFPWILGRIIVLPLFLLCSGKLMKILKNAPLFLFDYQGHLWYLGILFLFLLVYALYARFITPVNKQTSTTSKQPVGLLAALIIISGVYASFSCIYLANFDDWINILYTFRFQQARIVTYMCIFIMGIYAWKQNWFTKDGWAPQINFWRIWAISSIICCITAQILSWYYLTGTALLISKVIRAFLSSLCAFSAVIYLTMTALKFQATGIFKFFAAMAPYSYGIYWIHTPVMFLYLYIINDWNLPVLMKWFTGILLTSLFSALVCKYILKKISFLKQVF